MTSSSFPPSQETFWQVLEALGCEAQRRFLIFVSACARRPPEGWQHLELQVRRNGEGDERLPTAPWSVYSVWYMLYIYSRCYILYGI